MNIKVALELANNEFKTHNIENYFFETRELLAFVLGKTKEWIMSNIEAGLSEENYKKFLNLVNKRIQGLPLQYILGEQYFMGLKFLVNEDVLIPRADTEILVYKMIELCKNLGRLRILDLCTGSGCIAISLAKNLQNSEVLATDISESSLKVAKENSKINGTNVRFLKSNLFSELTGQKFDIIVSNPPYISADELKNLSAEVLKEPHLALYGGKDGLDFYRRISYASKDYLNDNGIVAFEIGSTQAKDVKSILIESKYKHIEIIKDYSDNDRVVIAKK